MQMVKKHINNSRKEDLRALKEWSEKEIANQDEFEQSQRRAELEEELNPSKYCLHRFYDMVRIITCLSSFSMLIGQILGMFLHNGHVGPIESILRLYIMVLCAMTCFNECEFTMFIRDSAILRIWISRGLLYAFIGILGLEENAATESRNHHSDASASLLTVHRHRVAIEYIRIVAWTMVGCGVLYFIMGISCLQVIVNSLRSDYIHRRQLADHSRRMTETFNGNASGNNSSRRSMTVNTV